MRVSELIPSIDVALSKRNKLISDHLPRLWVCIIDEKVLLRPAHLTHGVLHLCLHLATIAQAGTPVVHNVIFDHRLGILEVHLPGSRASALVRILLLTALVLLIITCVRILMLDIW